MRRDRDETFPDFPRDLQFWLRDKTKTFRDPDWDEIPRSQYNQNLLSKPSQDRDVETSSLLTATKLGIHEWSKEFRKVTRDVAELQHPSFSVQHLQYGTFASKSFTRCHHNTALYNLLLQNSFFNHSTNTATCARTNCSRIGLDCAVFYVPSNTV